MKAISLSFFRPLYYPTLFHFMFSAAGRGNRTALDDEEEEQEKMEREGGVLPLVDTPPEQMVPRADSAAFASVAAAESSLDSSGTLSSGDDIIGRPSVATFRRVTNIAAERKYRADLKLRELALRHQQSPLRFIGAAASSLGQDPNLVLVP